MTRRRAGLALQAGTTLLLLLLLFRGFDWSAFFMLFERLPLSFYVGSLLAVFSGILLYAWRWQLLLSSGGIRLSYRLVLQQYVVGVFANNFLPSTIGGDVVKVLYLGREHGYRAVGTSVLVDRLFGLGLLSLLAATALWLEPIGHPRYLTARLAVSAIAGAFVLAIVFALVGTGGLPGRVRSFGPVVTKLAIRLQEVRLDLARAVRSPRVWGQSLLTVAAYFVVITFVYQRFITLQSGLDPSFLVVLMAVSSTAVLSNIPVSINGLGLREQLHVLLLEPLGVGREVAVAISLLLFGHLLLVSLGGGLVWWRLRAQAAAPAQHIPN